jgi:membrane-bound serine protease (ClpP class)
MRRTSTAVLIVGLIILLAHGPTSGQPAQPNAPARPMVLELRLENEAITPISARIIERTIRQAEEQRAVCLVIVLDTPGGVLESTRTIVRHILSSRVPIVVFVAPPGARAASAGMFITMSAHVAAMAPGTNIGAAHPAQIGGLPGSPAPKDGGGEATMDVKILNDTVAWVKALAELRERNADWATRAVKESISAQASEAVREKAVDLLADDLNDLLAKIDGRTVKTTSGLVRLNTARAAVQTIEIWWGERLLSVIVNPTIAVLLLIFGFYGILFELYTPGWGVAGTLGIICLILGFLAMAILPINYVGLILLLVGLSLFVAELFVTSYGALTLGGVICLILGGVMLVDSSPGFVGVSLQALIPIALGTAAITFFLLGSIVRAHRGRVQTGAEEMLGMPAVAAEEFAFSGTHYAGLIRTHGELWKAVSATPIAAGQALEIQGRDGLVLNVRLKE